MLIQSIRGFRSGKGFTLPKPHFVLHRAGVSRPFHLHSSTQSMATSFAESLADAPQYGSDWRFCNPWASTLIKGAFHQRAASILREASSPLNNVCLVSLIKRHPAWRGYTAPSFLPTTRHCELPSHSHTEYCSAESTLALQTINPLSLDTLSAQRPAPSLFIQQPRRLHFIS